MSETPPNKLLFSWLNLKDEALTHLAGLISSQPLGYLTLNLKKYFSLLLFFQIFSASGITKNGLEKFMRTIEPSLKNISQPELFFNPS